MGVGIAALVQAVLNVAAVAVDVWALPGAGTAVSRRCGRLCRKPC